MENKEDNQLLGEERKKHNFMQVLNGSLQLRFHIHDDFDRGDVIRRKRSKCLPQIVSLPPSEYIKELSMTTEKRMELLTRGIRFAYTRKNINNSTECQDFQVVPDIILFQRYTLGNVYNAALTMRNTGKVSHHLKLTSDKHPNFTVENKGVAASLNIRLAPGMYTTYNVRFSPEENIDYEHEIKFTTDRESLKIPIIAIGPRAILDFPDIISIPETAVKILSSKSLLVRNLGDTPAIFSLYTSSNYFWLEPSKGVIAEEETVQFVVNFLPNKTGFFQDNLFLRYESGEIVRIGVQGSAIDCNVRLERASLRMPNEIYLGLSTSKSLKIFNRSNYIVNYRWMRYKDVETDRARKEKYKKIFDLITNAEIPRCVDLEHYNICMPEAHELVCQRIYADEIASLVEENFLYNYRTFSIVPMEGEIWPRSEVDVTVTFEPDEIGDISSIAYLEVTGREGRIPLSLSGVSVGPFLKLNVSSIDVQNILLCSVHNYEVICANKGLIPGVLVYRPKHSDFGGNIEVTPKHLKLQSGQYKSFNVSFSSNRNGDFVESVEFIVKESLQVVSMYIKGRIVSPTLRFDKRILDFGTTALGFTSRQEATLHNDSLVPVTFGITVPDDGTETAITREDFVNSQMKPTFCSSPREFIISPSEGIVEAQSSLKIQVNLTANVERIGKMTLRVDMWDSDSVPVSLPIVFRSIVASLFVKPPEMTIRFCYMNFPYSRNLVVENKSEVEGYFYLVPQTVSDSTTMLYSMSPSQGYLAPGQSKNICLEIITKATGEQTSVLRMLTFGDKAPTTCCTLTCNGQGPVVSAQPATLDFTNVELLQERTMILTLISDSPIPAEFKASLSSKSSPWSVTPSCGNLNPSESIDLRVTIFLRDIGKYSDTIVITITKGRTVIVSLNAIGVGSCVVCEPPIYPAFEMGSLFSRQDTSLPINLTNHGSRNLKLIFYNVMEIRMQGGRLQAPVCDKFSIEPFVFELPPRSTEKVFCKHVGLDPCGEVSEQWWLHCYVDGQSKRDIIGSSTFTATFIEPSISFSKNELSFCIEMTSRRDKSKNIDDFFVINKSELDFNAHLSIDSPFGIVGENGDQIQNLKIAVPKLTERQIRVFFSPSPEHKEKRHSLIISGILKLEYEEHSKTDEVKCLAALTFPNIAPLPREIRFNCPLACSNVENIFLTNDGPLEIAYKFFWIDELTSMKHEISNSKGTKDATPTKLNTVDPCDHTELLSEARKMLRTIVTDGSIADETEISVLQSLSTVPQVIDYMNEIFSIVPREGIVPANASQCVSIGFHAIETLSLEARLDCEIEEGPTESIQVFAATDAVNFECDNCEINFGEQRKQKSKHHSRWIVEHSCNYTENPFQMVGERSRVTINLKNLSKIDFVCHIELTEEPKEFLEIRPMSISIPALSTKELEIISSPVILGPFDEYFLIRAQYQNPVSITVAGIVVIPQIYVSLPRKDLFNDDPVELGYRAIQSMINSFDHCYENENGWEMVANNNTLPSIMDIEMAIERSIAEDFLRETRPFTDIKDIETKDDATIPYLFSPEYVLESKPSKIELPVFRSVPVPLYEYDAVIHVVTVTVSKGIQKNIVIKMCNQTTNLFLKTTHIGDMGYVIVGETSNASIRVYNYGSRSARVRLKKTAKLDSLSKHGINIFFRDQSSLTAGEFTDLQVSLNPPKLNAPEKPAAIKRKIYLEVTNGFTLPIAIVATVTVPSLSVLTPILDFHDVLIGECVRAHLQIKNEGVIDCAWEAKLPPIRCNQPDGPFYVHDGSDVYTPGQSGSIKIYFRPHKSGYSENQLTIQILGGLESPIVLLRGRGIEHKLKIVPPSINFDCAVPHSKPEGKTFTVENIGHRPLELYWQHLDKRALHEDRLIRVLAHYYQVNEILLPIRTPLATLPQQLFDFYDALVGEMKLDLATKDTSLNLAGDGVEKANDDSEGEDTNIVTVEESVIPHLMPKMWGDAKSRKFSKKLPRTRSSRAVSSELNSPAALSSEFESLDEQIPQDDPDEIEHLLHCFIDEFQNQPDFHEKMKDPVKEVFDALGKKEFEFKRDELSLLKKKRKMCIIFHGSPFTEYERAACTASRALGLSLLNLNKAMTEMIALGNTACSAKLRETIDTKYRQLLSVNDKANCKENFHTVDELNAFDSLTRYEYKIETIESNLEKMGTASISQETPRGGKDSARNTERSSRTARGAKGQETFLDIELKLFVGLLGQRLAMEDLNEGFALQSLHNRFITSEEKSLLLLLPTLGHVDHLIFVTFNTSAVMHDSKNSVTSNERVESIDEISKKLMDIDEMSLFEFDALSDSDKDLYREKIVQIRSKDALNKRMDFQQRLSELRKEKKVKLRRSMARSGNKGSKNLVKSKSRIMPNSEQPGEKLVTLEPPGKKKNEKIESSKSNGWKTHNEEIDIADGSDDYYSSLQAILSILNDWDPDQETIDTVKSKVLKNLKGENVTPTPKEDAVGATERFWIYYVKINDPRNSNDLNGILNEIAKNKQILVSPTPPLPVENKDDLRFQTYFVARPNSPPPQIRETFSKREPIHLIALKPRTFDHSSKGSLEINRSDSFDYLEEPLESRILLQPHEARTFKVYFSPGRPHSFQAEYSLGGLNANKSVFNLKITGTGDIPSIDMDSSKIFHTIKKVKKDYPTKPTFYEDVQTFDFGPLLLTGKGKKAHRKKTSFKFWNISKIDVELDVSLMASNLEAYNIKPKQLLIRPDEFGGVNVTAGFTNLGVNEDRLVLLVKDNPRVETIRLCNIGTKLEIALEGNNISFGRVMLYKQIRKKLIIHNNSLVPIFWKITPAVSVDSQLEFTPSMSWTEPRAGSEVVFTYLANRIGTMDTITLSYDVYLTDTDDPRETLFTETITITGETYDVAVDVNFANPIDLGTVKVGSITNSSFDIKNRGQYDVKFVIEFEESDKLVLQLSRDIRKNLMEDLQISPSIGNLVPDKIARINVTFHAKFGMSLRQVPLLRCNLIDANNSAIVVAEIPLTLSITSHYASFRLMPDSEISFGPVAICENKTLQLNVENTGFFPIKYHVKSAFLLTPSFENLSRKSKKEKSPKTDPKKRGTTKSQEVSANLRLGAFTIFDNQGNINAGDTKTLTIDCCPRSEGHLEEKILIDVDDSLLEGYSGKEVVLKVDSSLPRIDFRDLDAIFPESYLVDDIQDFHCPKEIDAYTILTRNERCLYFKRVKIHKPHSTSMKLHNRGLVPTRVTVHLRPDVLTPKNAKPDTFALDTVQECIPPMSSRVFSVSFTPSLIETYTGILEAWVELPDHLNHDLYKFAIKLSGEGCVPEVTVLEPSPDPHTGKRYIRFGRCLVDAISSRNIIFKNVGKIRTEVIVGIDLDTEMLYSVRKSAEFLNSSEFRNNSDPLSMLDRRSIICTLSPDETAQVTIDFRPNGISHKKAEIQFHVLDNPYEHLTVEIDGDGFMENVVLENLPLVENPRSNTSNEENRMRKSLKNRGNLSHSGSSITLTSRGVASTNLLYSLDYGTCPVNKMRRLNFKIANTTADRDFRFEFSSHPNVVFEPSIGHLRSFEKKEITATFLVTEPITYKEMILECAINEIRFPIERKEIRSWDDRQKTVEWIDVDNEEEDVSEFIKETSKQKMIVPTREPGHETLPRTFRTIQLIFSALAAYTKFKCITREIHFRDTLMFQNREYTFVLENSGNVDLFYYWKIDMEAGYPTRLPKISMRPPNLRPRSAKSDNSRPSSRASDGILYPEAEKQNLQKSTHSKFPREDEPRQTELNDLNYCERMALRDKSYIVDVEPFDCSTSSHTFDLFSDSFARTQRSSESWTENGDDQPFELKPDIGVIPARESIQFTLRFSPLDVFAYKANLICQIENLDPNLEQPNIVVTARSLLPYCHFDIEESDYLTSGRRDPNVVNLPQAGGGGDSNETTRDFLDLRVVEFRVLGVGDSHVKEFHLINPTTDNYRFTWKDLTNWKPDELPYFHCTYEEGLAESGKRTNVAFSFFASTIGTFESYWRFSIDRYNLETLFLLVATVAEPSIHFAETRLKLQPTVMGIKVEASLTIVNDEHQQFSWKILPNTLYSEEAVSQTLAVAPTSGTLQPTSKQILQVSLVPSCVGEFTFPLQCNVKGMKNPLVILVSARVNRIRPRILYSSTNKEQDILEARYDQRNVLNFGKLKLNEPATFKFEISNTRDIMFYYTWDLGTNDPRYLSQRSGAYFLTISKNSDHASSAVPSTCYLQLTALQKIIIRQHPVTLKIDGGPTYRMFVKASSKSPSVEFSFGHYNFGPSYIRGPTSPPYEAQLLVTNNDKTPAIIETQFENSPHMTVDLDALSQAIPGNSNATILINFHPTEPSIYRENLVFHINDSTVEQTVIIEGEGIFYKIRLENIRDKFVEFGNVPVGKVVTRKIRLVNAARAPVDAWFDTINKLLAYDEDRTQRSSRPGESTLHSKRTNELPSRLDGPRAATSPEHKDSISDMLSVKPEHNISLPAGKSTEITVKFVATRRVSSFVEKIGVQVDSTVLPLFFVRGSCVAREFCLDRNHLYFGTVIEGCTKTAKLVLRNNGDFGARFKWNVSKLTHQFDLQPVSGYCSPGMDVTLDVTFHPKQLSPIVEAEATVDIEKHPSLKIKCSGACAKIPDAIEVIDFATPVRSAKTKNLTIVNETNDAWNVKTALNGEYFRTEDTFVVPAKKTYSCAIVYSPLVMNTEKNPHEGRLIVKLPEGKQPLVYSLFGSSLPPKVEGKIVRQLPAKTKFAELLPAHNWLNRPQCFHCDIKLINDSQVNPVIYSFTGNLRLDVPAGGTRDYRATFHCYVETTLNFLITFTNDDGEYEFYEIQYKVSKPDTLSTIKLTTPARSTTRHQLEIVNPLNDRPVIFSASCQHPDITIHNATKVVTAKSTDKIIIEYSPLVPGENITKLNVTCAELGNYPYEVKLKATPALAEKVIRVTAMLGSSTNFPIIINNATKKNTEFTITVDDPSFTCNRKISIPPQKDGILEVNYEPCHAKNARAMLIATSQALGEIRFPLIGCYDPPKPQGPFTISQNTTTNIPFKNVFGITKTFAYVIDGANEFSVVKFPSVIKSKEVATIAVKFSSGNGSSVEERQYPITGKLVVSYVEPTPSLFSWVYYLRGIR